MKKLEELLLKAAGKDKDEISPDNPYREIGFDGNQPRLGWVKGADFHQVRNLIESIENTWKDKETFIFIGMGGSVNGIKPLLKIFPDKKFFTLDSLDPKAIDTILASIGSLEKTLVVLISKSGTTKETQLLAQTLKGHWTDRAKIKNWADNFLWLADPGSFEKLNNLGWQGVRKITIQADFRSDIGGRFSSPLTAIFLFPLFLLLGRDFNRLKEIYLNFIDKQPEIRKDASRAALAARESVNFSPFIAQDWSLSFTPWLVQLFQESLGGKGNDKSVKTIINFSGKDFIKLETDCGCAGPVLSIMLQMYYYQVFVACLAGIWEINFVNQQFVEEYKKKMRDLESEGFEGEVVPEGGRTDLLDEVSGKIKPNQRFIEIVLYFWPSPDEISFFREKFSKKFPQKEILIFIGSDWNHQSYQAAFNDRRTFFILICLAKYSQSRYILKKSAENNIKTLRQIALATNYTLSDKSILYNLK